MGVTGKHAEEVVEYLRRSGQSHLLESAKTAKFPSDLPIGQIDQALSETKPGKKEFVAAAFDPAGIWTIPCWLASEANTGGKLSAAIRRKGTVKNAIWGALGPGWRIWGPAGDRVRAAQSRRPDGPLPVIRVVRLGGRGLDVGNLWRAVKPVEDAVAILMGCDDGWTAWRECFRVDQEPGPLWGVRIEIRLPQSS